MKDLNLMPDDAIIKQNYRMLKKTLLFSGGIFLLICLIVDLGLYIGKWNYNYRTEDLEQQIKLKLGNEVDQTVLGNIKGKIDYRQAIANRIDQQRLKTTKFLDDIERMVPKDLTITKLSINKNKEVMLEGDADTENSVIDFFHSLKNEDITDYVVFNSMGGKFGDKKGFKFSFAFTLKG